MSQIITWSLPGEALDLPRIERAARGVAERVGVEFQWYELELDESLIGTDEELEDGDAPTGEGFVNVAFTFPVKRRLDVLWKADPARLPADLAAADGEFQPVDRDTYTVELTFVRDDERSAGSTCLMWVDDSDADNEQAWLAACALGHALARELEGELQDGDEGTSDLDDDELS